jgi:hypothetical protein
VRGECRRKVVALRLRSHRSADSPHLKNPFEPLWRREGNGGVLWPMKDNVFNLNDDMIISPSLFSFCSPAANLEPREYFDLLLIKLFHIIQLIIK